MLKAVQKNHFLKIFIFLQRRDKKSAYETPKPFVVTAGLHIAEQTDKEVSIGSHIFINFKILFIRTFEICYSYSLSQHGPT
jgi:Tfp pilus assembly protein PilZ